MQWLVALLSSTVRVLRHLANAARSEGASLFQALHMSIHCTARPGIPSMGRPFTYGDVAKPIGHALKTHNPIAVCHNRHPRGLIDRGRHHMSDHVGTPDRDLANVAPIDRGSPIKVINCAQK
jgi:hypothetical protein